MLVISSSSIPPGLHICCIFLGTTVPRWDYDLFSLIMSNPWRVFKPYPTAQIPKQWNQSCPYMYIGTEEPSRKCLLALVRVLTWANGEAANHWNTILLPKFVDLCADWTQYFNMLLKQGSWSEWWCGLLTQFCKGKKTNQIASNPIFGAEACCEKWGKPAKS